MSQENVELVRDFLNFTEVDEVLADPQRLAGFFAPDATWDLGGFSALLGRSETRKTEEFLEFLAVWMEPYDDFSYETEKILDAGANRVVATFHHRGRLRDSDSWVEMHYGFVYTVEGGLITRAQGSGTPAEALEAAGVRD